eukprot:12188541-Alexandrium_andersonii.AAC.1
MAGATAATVAAAGSAADRTAAAASSQWVSWARQSRPLSKCWARTRQASELPAAWGLTSQRTFHEATAVAPVATERDPTLAS